MRRPQPPVPGRYQTDLGTTELLADGDHPGGWELCVDGVPQSYVDIDDPTHLEFEYVQLIGDVLDTVAAPTAPITVLHLGGGACTLARYVAATRPGSPQLVFERDAALVELVRAELGTEGFRLRVADARAGLATLGDASGDVVIGDTFVGAALPPTHATVEHVREVRRVLRPGGCYVLNVADGKPLDFARSQVATMQTVFAKVVLLAEPAVLRGRRFGTRVLAGSDDPLPVDELGRRTARAAGTARVLFGQDIDRFRAGSAPITAETARPSPVPPPSVFGR